MERLIPAKAFPLQPSSQEVSCEFYRVAAGMGKVNTCIVKGAPWTHTRSCTSASTGRTPRWDAMK